MDRLERTVALIRRRRREAHLTSPRKHVPRQQPPTGIQLDYWNALKPMITKAQEVVKRELYPFLPHVLAEHARAHEATRMDAGGLLDLTAKLHNVAGQMVDMLDPKQLWWLANQFGQQTSDFQRGQLNRAVRAVLGVDLGVLEPGLTPRLESWTAANVSLIRSIPKQYASEIENRVMAGVREGERWEQMAAGLEERYGVTERRAQLIARDQVGKLYGQLNEERQSALGVTGYVWRTSQDARVRDEHEEREGESYQWDAPPEDGHPGEPVNCRCYAEPDFSGVVEGLSEPG